MKNILLILLVFLFPVNAFAAEISVAVPHDRVRNGDTILLPVTLDTQSATINAIQGMLSVSNNLRLTRIRLVDSFVPLWIEQPHIEKGTVLFAGVVPGGYRGLLGTGWKGYRAGTLLTLELTALAEGPASVVFGTTTSVFANDGSGTGLPLTALGVSFTVLPEAQAHRAPAVAIDSEQPEIFSPLVSEATPFGQNGFVLVFSTTDKQSDILYYEFAHSRTSGAETKPESVTWERVESPYLLSENELHEYLYVRATDAYGNVRVAVVPPVEQIGATELLWRMLVLVLIFCVLGLLIFRPRIVYEKK